MQCNAQVHEKINKQGTWAFHLVDGWYLFTSLKHYRTHNCHVKHTKRERLSDTVQFQHKHITNPSITQVDKVMSTLADWVKAIQGITGRDRNSLVTKDLLRIVDATQAQIKAQPDQFEHTATPTDTPQGQQVLRVQMTARVPIPYTVVNRRVMCSMSMLPPVPRVPNYNTTTIKPPTLHTKSTGRVHMQKRHTALIKNTEIMINTTPRVQT